MTDLIKEYSNEYQEYLRDESRTTGHADSIAFPKTEEEIREVLRYCWQHDLPVTIQGGRTGLAAAAVPKGGQILNLTRMKAITGCRKGDKGEYYLSLDPGVVLTELKKAIESKKIDTTGWDHTSIAAYHSLLRDVPQFFTPDPTEASATIGGMVACNASGARSFCYGATRGHISGLRVVLADGDLLVIRRGECFAEGRSLCLTTESGKTLRLQLPTYEMPKTKNASGYYIEEDMDAIDLFIGSDGTLGVISQVEISLLPLPQQIWGATCFFHSEDKAVDAVIAIREAVKGVAAMEYFDGDALSVLRRQKSENPAFAKLPQVEPWAKAAVYIELHCGSEEEVADSLFQIGDLLDAAGASQQETWVARNQADLDRLMFFRHAVPESVNMLIDRRKQSCPVITKLGTDMSVPDAYLGRVMAFYRRELEANGLESAVWGHIGDNHLHVNILPRSAEEYATGKTLYQRWAKEICAMGGAVSAEHGVGKIKANLLTIMYGAEHIQQMRALKASLDPKGLLGIGNMMEEV